MARAVANGINIEYESFGPKDAEALLLIMGLSGTMMFWPLGFVEELVGRGYRVIRYDHRDTGLSDKLDNAGVPDITAVLDAVSKGEPAPVAYTMDAVAADAVGLLDALGIEKAHLLGASFGGLVAQFIAVNHPEHVLSLIPMHSAPANREIAGTEPWVQELMLGELPDPAEDREGYINATMAKFLDVAPNGARGTGSPGYPPHHGHVRVRTEMELDRGHSPGGFQRHLAALLGARDIRNELKSITVPTIVIHGQEDVVVPLASGRDTASNIPGAELIIFPGLSHDFPPALWGAFADAVDRNSEKAKSSAS